MNSTELKLAIEKITYKEGWQLHLRYSHEIPFIYWSWWAPDATKPGSKPVHVTGPATSASGLTEDQLVKLALQNVLTCEEHEAREFFRYEGEQIFDPHAPCIPKKSGAAQMRQMMRQMEPAELKYWEEMRPRWRRE